MKNLGFRYTSYLKAHYEGHADIQANFVAGLDYLDYPLNNMNKTPGAVTFDYASGIRVEGCSFSCMSAAALDYSVGVSASTVVGNRFEEIGASGIQVGTVKVRDGQPMSKYGFVDGSFVDNLTPDPGRITHDVLVLCNVLDGIGTQFKGAIAIMAGYVSDVTIAHNDISNTSYTAISAGWGWGSIDNDPRALFPSQTERVLLETPSVMERYVIENNNISNIMLERHDGGGIYTLSDMPGSIISGNVIKDSQHRGIYNDEASGGFAEIAENIVVNTPQPYFYQYVISEYSDRLEATENVMRDNYWNHVPTGDALYDSILDNAGVLAGVSIPNLPVDVPATNPPPSTSPGGESGGWTEIEKELGDAEPGATTSRVMIVTILHRLEGTPTSTAANIFSDVPAGQWYTDAVVWAAEHKIAEGYNGYFSPNDPVTREQMAAIFWRYAKYKGCDVSVGENTNILSYEDALNVSEYAIPAMQWACGAGIITGIDSANGGKLLDPQGRVIRSQAATIITRFCKNIFE